MGSNPHEHLFLRLQKDLHGRERQAFHFVLGSNMPVTHALAQ